MLYIAKVSDYTKLGETMNTEKCEIISKNIKPHYIPLTSKYKSTLKSKENCAYILMTLYGRGGQTVAHKPHVALLPLSYGSQAPSIPLSLPTTPGVVRGWGVLGTSALESGGGVGASVQQGGGSQDFSPMGCTCRGLGLQQEWD